MSPSLPLFPTIRNPFKDAPWYVGIIRVTGWVIVLGGLHAMVTAPQRDVTWGLFLLVVGLLAQQVATWTALALYGSTLVWAGVANVLFGRVAPGLILGLLGAALLVTGLVLFARRTKSQPWPALDWGSLALGITGALTLTVALGGSLAASLTGWALDARLADMLASSGAHQAALAGTLALAALLQRSRNGWAAVLGGLAGALTVFSYVILLLLAQG